MNYMSLPQIAISDNGFTLAAVEELSLLPASEELKEAQGVQYTVIP